MEGVGEEGMERGGEGSRERREGEGRGKGRGEGGEGRGHWPAQVLEPSAAYALHVSSRLSLCLS